MRADCAKLRDIKNSVKTSGNYLFIINWSLNKIILNLVYDLSVSRNPLSKSKNGEICEFGLPIFSIVRVRVIWHMFELQFMIKKWSPDLLTRSTTLYDVCVLCNLFSKAEMRQFGASGTNAHVTVGNWPVKSETPNYSFMGIRFLSKIGIPRMDTFVPR